MKVHTRILIWPREKLSALAPPGVDFTNIFMPSLCLHGAQKRKKIDDLTAFFTLLGSARIKAVCRTLMKLSPDDHWKLRPSNIKLD